MRKVVMPDDLLYYFPEWDRKLQSAIKNFLKVDQPLKHLIPRVTLKKAEDIAGGLYPLDSIRSCFCGQTTESALDMSYSKVDQTS